MEGWRRALAGLRLLRGRDRVRCAVYGAWLSLLLVSSLSWVQAVKVYRTRAPPQLNYSSTVVFLGYEHAGRSLRLSFYRSFAWPSLSPLEVRITEVGPSPLRAKLRVPPSRVFTLILQTRAEEIGVEVLMDEERRLNFSIKLSRG